ncbi:protein LAZY 1-like isoform X2 [Senna tora]|uniref:Protein LAZY 1-like isoform X2 n=1 Tax=Senna tora TaxID=362788 RepID=A0A834X7Q7_9FABA|nr:protein LAZY 1-like isoform X2 [Senna tora]
MLYARLDQPVSTLSRVPANIGRASSTAGDTVCPSDTALKRVTDVSFLFDISLRESLGLVHELKELQSQVSQDLHPELLLGWMHRKFRQNSGEPLKDLVIGQSALDDPQNYQKPNHGTKYFRQTQRDQNIRKSFAGLEAAKVGDDDYYEDESPAALSDLFHGFLAIGTLGTDQVITDPSTPTFAISVENITENEDEVTEDELKLINDELEKVLVDSCNDSSGRNSHVSTGRSSHGSIITLSGKPMEGTEANGSIGSAICPLQGYLFGSAIEMSETTTTVAKKEHRTSLGELFQRSKLAEENSGGKWEREDKRTEREADKSAMNLMKRKLKKRMLLASSRNSASINGAPVDSASAETKFHKILHMFHRKVHPETSTAIEKSGKTQKHENKKKMMSDGSYNRGDLVYPEEDNMVQQPRKSLPIPKDVMRNYKNQANPLQFALGSGDSFGNREHWIKTDADCPPQVSSGSLIRPTSFLSLFDLGMSNPSELHEL